MATDETKEVTGSGSSAPCARPSIRIKRVVAVLFAAALCALFVFVVLRERSRASAMAGPSLSCFSNAEFPIDQGIVLVALLGLDCHHCHDVARQLGVLDVGDREIGIYYVFLGEPAEVEPFFQKAQSRAPYVIANAKEFFAFVPDVPPVVFLLRSGQVIAQWDDGSFGLDSIVRELAKTTPSP